MKFFTSNDLGWRLLRTIVQGMLGVIIANLDLLIGYFTIAPELKPFIVALTMAVLSPVMALMGGKEEHESK